MCVKVVAAPACDWRSLFGGAVRRLTPGLGGARSRAPVEGCRGGPGNAGLSNGGSGRLRRTPRSMRVAGSRGHLTRCGLANSPRGLGGGSRGDLTHLWAGQLPTRPPIGHAWGLAGRGARPGVDRRGPTRFPSRFSRSALTGAPGNRARAGRRHRSGPGRPATRDPHQEFGQRPPPAGQPPPNPEAKTRAELASPCQVISSPPSTASACPVISDAASDIRNTTCSATLSGVAMRPSGIVSEICSMNVSRPP